MKLGSKKHLQNPKLPTVVGAAPTGNISRGTIINPKQFVPKTYKKKKRK